MERDDELMEGIPERTARVVDSKKDNLGIVQVCLSCAKKVETMGIGRKPEVPDYFLF